MNLKNKFKKFFTLRPGAEDGFTLVELVVVIVILGLLSGVTFPLYSDYIDTSKKGNDIVMVGNVIRAIDTGVNSSMYSSQDSFQLGNLSYPVGFVTLTPNGASVVASTTQMTPGVEGDCEIVTVTIKYAQNSKISYECTSVPGDKDKLECYSITEEKISYCATHTPENLQPVETTADTNYPATYTHQGTQVQTGLLWNVIPVYECEGHAWNAATYVTIPAGSLSVNNKESLYAPSSANPSLCEYAYANQYGSFTGENTVGATSTGDPLYDSLIAAYGSLDELKLTYDGWTSSGIDYPTFYSSAPQLMEDVENLSGLLVGADKAASLVGKDLGLSGDYDNGEEVLQGVSSNITSTHTEATWLEQWNNDANMTWDSYGFGLQGRENYSAARMGYNSSFASYLEAKGVDPAYAEVIRNFNSQEMYGIGLPGLVCTDAFTDPDSPLKSKILAAEAVTTPTEDDFNNIAALYQEYVSSGANTENGKLLYNTMGTFNETFDVATEYANQNDISVYDYYDSYVNEISTLYSTAQAAAGDGIVIIVSVINGNVHCSVSPAAADPRAAN